MSTSDQVSAPPRFVSRAVPGLCLNMIVRDEAHVVCEALASVAGYIDYWVIVDTGSTDDTIAVIETFFRERGIAGEIHQRPWVDFGVNRSEALKLCNGKCVYAWVIDADDLLVGEFSLSSLTKDAYLLRYGSDFSYWRQQIFRVAADWKYEGVLHEYPRSAKADLSEGRIEGAYHVESRRLGSRSREPDKYRRDAQTLEAALQTDPDNTRYVFYLAQSYRDAGDQSHALAAYTRRTLMGGWDEEVFYSLLQCARCLEALSAPWEQALAAYLRCWQFRPSRAEPLYWLAKHYREQAEYELGALFARRAAVIVLPEQDRLFIATDVYTWRVKDELSICEYFVGRVAESFELYTQLLACADLPEAERERVLLNRSFATPHMQAVASVYPEAIVARLTARRAVASGATDAITLTITTCRRFNLFTQSVNSFLNCCLDLERIGRWICVDDGSNDADRAQMQALYPFFEFIDKDRAQKGHARSMNLILQQVKTPYWLHLEDDWLLFAPERYIGQMLAVLDDDPAIGQVLFNRNYAERLSCQNINGGAVKFTARERLRYRLHEHHEQGTNAYDAHINQLIAGQRSNAWWPHYSLRPSLLRMSAIATVGAYRSESTNFELDFANRYTAAGYRSAFLDAINALHIGRLTWQRGDATLTNAADLNDEPQLE
ncbi:MAG: glycosyltransferase [Rhizobacter sp.]|nr:glycosyltransferase [Burkholderiales bacterium]